MCCTQWRCNRAGVVMMVGGAVLAVAVSVIAWSQALVEGLELGRQAAWRPGTIGMVSSSWLAALCKQLLCLKVTARYLGSGCGLKLGRQAAWRPGTIGMVSSSCLAALCKQLLCLKVIARYLGSDCGLKLGRQAAWRPGTIGMVSSSCLAASFAVAVNSDCRDMGSGCGLKLGRQAAWRPGTSGWCRQVCWRHCASSCCV